MTSKQTATEPTNKARTPEISRIPFVLERVSVASADTPVKASSHSHQPPPTVAEMRPAVEAELAGSIIDYKAPRGNIYDSYKDLQIQEFLQSCNLFEESRGWTTLKKLAEDAKKNRSSVVEKTLYKPFNEIFEAIFNHFDQKTTPRLRWIKDTHKTAMQHKEDGVLYFQVLEDGTERRVVLKTSPDLAIMGAGKRLRSKDVKIENPQYPQCIAPLEVKTDNTLKKEEVVLQVGVYARQCFIQQPHRRYVPTIILTESSAYIHVYDRSGVLRLTPEIDIHADPVTFIQTVLGISSIAGHQEGVLFAPFSPFDTRVEWAKGAEHPTILVTNQWANADTAKPSKSYSVFSMRFVRRTVRGRGTVCWDAVDSEAPGEAVLIKDSWRSTERVPEWSLLMETQGTDGIGEMIAYEEDRENVISRFRDFVCKGIYAEEAYPHDRTFSRIVLKAYGRSIKYFDNKLQLLYAFRDTVAGHKTLWAKRRILHRDVSIDNILLGNEGAPVGNRGILIDLDMAIKVDRTSNLSGSQFRTGTRAFQSAAVLNAEVWGESAPPQDHLDDLESFFYVLAWICLKYDGPHNPQVTAYLNLWENSNANICASTKQSFLTFPNLDSLRPYFSQDKIFRDLLDKLAELCSDQFAKKTKMARKHAAFPRLPAVHEDAKERDHDAFLKIVDEAIRLQEQEPAEFQYPLTIPQTRGGPPVTPTGSTFVQPADPKTPRAHYYGREGPSNNLKRQSDASSDEEHQGSSKRSRSSVE